MEPFGYDKKACVEQGVWNPLRLTAQEDCTFESFERRAGGFIIRVPVSESLMRNLPKLPTRKPIYWIDEVNVVCNIKYNKHMHMRINHYMNINMIRFRVGAWRINVNNLNMKQIVISERYCDYCEDEEHVIFHCEAYGNCRLRHQPLFHGTKHNLKTFLTNGWFWGGWQELRMARVAACGGTEVVVKRSVQVLAASRGPCKNGEPWLGQGC